MKAINFINKIFLIVLLLFVYSCSSSKKNPKITYDDYNGFYKVGSPYKIKNKWYYPKSDPNYDEVGVASWYGKKFHGRKTANGDTFDKEALTAAHKTLPMPSMVRVTNLENDKTIILMVNDRGPFSKKRIIDVSERAAGILGFKEKGLAQVRVQFLPGQTAKLWSDYNIKVSAEQKQLLNDSARAKLKTPKNLTSAVVPSENINPIKNNTPLSPLIEKEVPTSPIPLQVSKQELEPMKIKDYPATDPDIIKLSKLLETEEAKKNKMAMDETKLRLSNEDKISAFENRQIQPIPIAKPDKLPPIKKTKIVEIGGNSHFIQVGTYSIIENANRVKKKLLHLADVTIYPVNTTNGNILYRVRLGPMKSKQITNIAHKKVIALGHPDAIIVKN